MATMILPVGGAPPSHEKETSLSPRGARGDTPDVMLIPEILSQILFHVPTVFLLTTARLVNKSWKQEIESNPILRWKCWVPNCDQYLAEKKAAALSRPSGENTNNVLEDVSFPPPSIRNDYSNRHCKCSPTIPPSPNWICNTHSYTDQFQVHPIALHFLQLFWRNFMRVPLSRAEEIVSEHSRDMLMDELVALIKPKLKHFENSLVGQGEVQGESGVRLNTSNLLIRPETFSSKVYLYCGIQHEALIQTLLFDNGTKAALAYSSSARTSRRKMLAVKDLVYNVMHRSLYGDKDINEIRESRESKTETSNAEIQDPLPRYYTVLLHIEGKPDDTMPNQRRGGVDDTEIEITLALFEPFDIVNVQTRRLSESTQNVDARYLARFSSHLERSSWNKDYVCRKTPWRVWARAMKPAAGDQMPSLEEVCDFYMENCGTVEQEETYLYLLDDPDAHMRVVSYNPRPHGEQAHLNRSQSDLNL
ncbi:hypothetical protein AA313_de0201099 [Arthrobotrys entomopaga]|nr:hypothetical protein AA313_de0201099 [Arthrobotrys entomopaga]